jgi:RimJ/RimL family protein N-acetyltransferase
MAAPLLVTTERLLLRRPEAADAEAIFTGYASDRDALRYMSWPAHESLAATRAFLAFSDAEWEKWPAGPYVIFSRAHGRLLGGTGFAFESPTSAVTGYVLARDAWGKGFATEALRAVVGVAADLGVTRLTAICHAVHRASQRVLEKAGFVREAGGPGREVFPNLGPEPQDVVLYAIRPTTRGA